MLNVTGLSGSPDNVIRYVREKIRQYMAARNGERYQAGYYANGAPSQWSGKLASEFGLEGEVDLDDFKNLLEGKTPDGVSFAKERPDRRMGSDLTFSAPKSVSIEALANGDARFVDWHEQAVEYALNYIESNVLSARYGKNGVRSEKTGNSIFARFRHENARPVDGKTQPSLHDHVIALNVTRGSNGDLRATDLDFGNQSVRLHTADALYKAKYAELIESAGIETRQTANGFELAHITDEQIRNHSDREQQIEEYLEQDGRDIKTVSGAERGGAGLVTRNQKGTKPQHQLIIEWRNAARNQGIPYADDAQKDYLSIDFDNPDAMLKAARNAVDQALESHGEREAVLSREQVLLESIQNGIGQASPEDIRDALDNHEAVYSVGTDELVTQKALDRERAIMDAASSGRGQHDPIYSENDVQERIAQHEQQTGIEYSDGQKAALQLALTSADQTAAVVGAAGAGKTTSMATISSEAAAAGYHVIGLAPSKVASEALSEAGISDTQTLASWHKQERDPNGPARYIVVDESGMVADRDMQQLFDGLRPDDRVLLVGDPRQLQPVEAGSSYSEMLRTGAIEYAKIDEIRRQNDPNLLRMSQAFARGDTDTATSIAMEYATEVDPERNERGKITTKERREAIASETAQTYLKLDASTRDDTVVLSGTNDTRSQINRQIRDGLINEGVVDNANAQSVTALAKPSKLTKPQLQQARHYQPRQVVTMRDHNQTRQYTVDSVDTRANTITMRDQETGESRTENAINIPKRGQLYNPTSIDLGRGDRVLFNENDRDRDIVNGDSGRVTAVNDDGVHITLDRLDNGDPINLTVDPERGAVIDYAYARTIHKAQGITEQNAIVAGESSKSDTAEMGYVATSREKDNLWVITDNANRLQKSWQKYADKQTANSAMKKAAQNREGIAREQAREQQFESELAKNEGRSMSTHNSARELNQFKKWDLAEHMRRDGFERDSKESTRGYEVMRRNEEKLIVTEKHGHQIYSDAHDSSNAGTIIDYEKNQHGRRLGEARHHLRAIGGGPADAAVERDHRAQGTEKDTRAVAARYSSYRRYAHENSYLERRGLDAETVAAFDVRQDERGNPVFRHRNIANQTVGYEAKNDNFAGFAAGGERALNMEKIGDGDINRVVITESSIDSMSHYQHHRQQIDAENKATVYISTGGSMTERQANDIREVVRRTGVDEVRLAHDADASGDRMADRLGERLGDTGASIQRDKPRARDWNEQLQIEQRQAQQAEKAQQNESAADRDTSRSADTAADHEQGNDDNQSPQAADQPESRLKQQRGQDPDQDQGFESGL